jgi:GT2 family glycosyltransferase
MPRLGNKILTGTPSWKLKLQNFSVGAVKNKCVGNSVEKPPRTSSKKGGKLNLGSPKVAVVIPARNRSDLLGKCLHSLAEQRFPLEAFEILVCDDGSNEDLKEIVKSFQPHIPNIRLLRQTSKGPAAARNLGFRFSAADIFVCVDSDIVCGKSFINNLIRSLEENPDWVAAEASVLPAKERPSILWDAPESRGGAFPSGASAYRIDALRRAGGFDEEFLLPACEDVDLAARLLKIGGYGFVPEAIAYHPVRRVTVRTHWRWRRHWKYETILAKRYGFLSFPRKPIGRFPRGRVALAAIITLPAGRFLEGLKFMRCNPVVGILACLYALFDVFCGICALPQITFSPIPPGRNYLIMEQEKGFLLRLLQS